MLVTEFVKKLNQLAGGAKWSVLSRPLHVDGSVCAAPVGSRVRCLRYVNGESIHRTSDGFIWVSTTVDDGLIVENFEAELNALGVVVGGYLNCFGLGRMAIDDEYLQEYAAAALEREDWAAC